MSSSGSASSTVRPANFSDIVHAKFVSNPAGLGQLFPQLAGIETDYCWGGLVDMTKDRYLRAGCHEGLWYAMGYSGVRSLPPISQ
jgi:glycine/D-amino acid oxidase-like deaminating enzyme